MFKKSLECVVVSFSVIREKEKIAKMTTGCHSLSLVEPLVVSRCHSLSLDVSLVCLFINERALTLVT